MAHEEVVEEGPHELLRALRGGAVVEQRVVNVLLNRGGGGAGESKSGWPDSAAARARPREAEVKGAVRQIGGRWAAGRTRTRSFLPARGGLRTVSVTAPTRRASFWTFSGRSARASCGRARQGRHNAASAGGSGMRGDPGAAPEARTGLVTPTSKSSRMSGALSDAATTSSISASGVPIIITGPLGRTTSESGAPSSTVGFPAEGRGGNDSERSGRAAAARAGGAVAGVGSLEIGGEASS